MKLRDLKLGKKIIILIAAVLFCAGAAFADFSSLITREQADAIVKRELNMNDAILMNVKLNKDPGKYDLGMFWPAYELTYLRISVVEGSVMRVMYDIVMNAVTGKILKIEAEIKD